MKDFWQSLEFDDKLYMLGVSIIWLGNFHQIWKVWATQSASDFSLIWLSAMWVSFLLRTPKAWRSIYWVWRWSYAISIAIMLVLLISVIIHY